MVKAIFVSLAPIPLSENKEALSNKHVYDGLCIRDHTSVFLDYLTIIT